MQRVTTTYVMLNIVILKLGWYLNSTLRERIDKSIFVKLIKAKVHSRLGHPVKKILIFTNELAGALHKPVSKKFETRLINVNGIDEIWAADLIDMQAFSKQNKGIKYLLTVIDVFSKRVWIIPIKQKTRKEIAGEFSKIFENRRGSKLWVNKGSEFYSKDVRKQVELYCTENEEKYCVIERFNHTINEKNYKYFLANSTRKYIDVLDTLVDEYNNTIHPSIKMIPVEASLKKNEIQFGEIYIQILVKPQHQNFQLVIMLE